MQPIAVRTPLPQLPPANTIPTALLRASFVTTSEPESPNSRNAFCLMIQPEKLTFPAVRG
jgi:hypothetical protein